VGMKKVSNRITICEVLREINDIHQSDSDIDIITRKKLAIAERMAKKICMRLLIHKKEDGSPEWIEWLETNPDKESDILGRLMGDYKYEEIEDEGFIRVEPIDAKIKDAVVKYARDKDGL
jgi:hypothetical protein